MTVSFVTVACLSDKRWFDLDAVRHEPLRADNGNTPKVGGVNAVTGSRADDGQRYYTDANPAGAPPLDWWDETDPPPTPRHDGTTMTTTTVTFHCGDVRDVMATMPDSSVDLVVTSPPFLALRSYLPPDHPDKHREIGSEATPAAFLDTMLGLTADWRRLVTPTGSIAVEIGDTYSGSGGDNHLYEGSNPEGGFNGSRNQGALPGQRRQTSGWPLPKSLCGIPTLYTWSLAYGRNLLTGQPSPAGQWRIRNLLTWTRPNPPVGALGDKFRPATSFVTVACTSDKRWFDLDAVRTESVWMEHRNMYASRYADTGKETHGSRADGGKFTSSGANPAGAPPLDWWDESEDWQPLHRLPTAPYAGAHYATYPIALPRRLIEAMCPREVCVVCGEARRRITAAEYTHDKSHNNGTFDEKKPVRGFGVQNGAHAQAFEHGRATKNVTTLGWSGCNCVTPCPTHGFDKSCRDRPSLSKYRPGVVLDPFAGSGTTAVAAALAGRDAVLIDIDHRNVELTRRRLGEAVAIINERVDGDTTVWTVNASLPGLKGEHPDQQSLFAEEAS